jgi:hypothetical protein
MTQRKPAKRTEAVVVSAKEPTALLADLWELILQAREGVARAVDSGLTALYWHVGRRIRQDILKEKRAEYGARIVAALGRQLTTEFGRGFSRRNLFNMVRFAEVFPDPRIVQPLAAQLSWTRPRKRRAGRGFGLSRQRWRIADQFCGRRQAPTMRAALDSWVTDHKLLWMKHMPSVGWAMYTIQQSRVVRIIDSCMPVGCF